MVCQSHHRRRSLDVHRFIPEQHLTLVLDSVLSSVLGRHIPCFESLLISPNLTDTVGREDIRVY